jgi:nucleoside-diphosphate-sugar epimerase
MKILVGHTGLIGRNLSDNIDFDFKFNSSNIDKYDEIVPDECDLYLACLPATMWSVNSDLIGDLENILNIVKKLKNKQYKNVFLFSTIAVYCDSPKNSNETFLPQFEKTIYGSNRYLFEMLVRDTLEYNSLKILRLPALFGKYLKKNVFYDLMNAHQTDQINTASTYQWYNLANLWKDTERSKDINGEVINLFSEPILTKELITSVFNLSFESNKPFKVQNFKTIHSDTGYWESASNILDQMRDFLNENRD